MSYRSYYGKTESRAGFWVAGFFVVALIVFLIVNYQQESTYTETVCMKERAAVEGGAEYRIYTTGDTFVMSDTLINGRFDTADAYGRIKEGHKYEFVTVGWRVPFLSMFENIIESKDLGPDGGCE